MKSYIRYRVGVGLAFVVIMSAGSGASAYAQSAGGCFSGPAKMSDADVSSFTGSPGNLLTSNPTGGLPMSSQVRTLAGSSATALDSLMGLVGQANLAQKSALGAGLARVAKSCQPTSPDYAQLIQQKVASANDKDLTAAFTAALNDVQTAALGGPAGAGGGGAAGIAGGGGAAGSSGQGTDSGTATAAGNDSFSVGTRAAFTTGGTTNTTFITNTTTNNSDPGSPSG